MEYSKILLCLRIVCNFDVFERFIEMKKKKKIK